MGKFHEMVKDYESHGLLTEAALWAMISDIDGMLEEVLEVPEHDARAIRRETL